MGNEDQDRADTADDSISYERAHEFRDTYILKPNACGLCKALEESLQQLHQGIPEGEGELKDPPNHQQEERNAEQTAGHDAVDFV